MTISKERMEIIGQQWGQLRATEIKQLDSMAVSLKKAYHDIIVRTWPTTSGGAIEVDVVKYDKNRAERTIRTVFRREYRYQIIASLRLNHDNFPENIDLSGKDPSRSLLYVLDVYRSQYNEKAGEIGDYLRKQHHDVRIAVNTSLD